MATNFSNTLTPEPPRPTPGKRASGASSTSPASRTRSNKSRAKSAKGRRPRVPKREAAAITSQLAIMIRTGVDIASALNSLARQCQRPALRRILEVVHEGVMDGNSLSDSLAQFDDVFGEGYVASIAAGEASGRLAEVLKQLADLQRNEVRLAKSIRTLLTYPILLASISSLVIIALVVFVLPRFAQIFRDFNASLPATTQMLLSVSDEVQTRYWLWLPLAAIGVGGLVALRYSQRGRRFWDQLILKAFIIKDISQALTIGRVCRLLGTMLDSGLPLLESLRLVRSSLRNSLYRELFGQLEENVLNGRGLSTALMNSTIIPPAAVEMIVTAERTGTLGMVSRMLGEHFEEDGEARLKEFIGFLEPVITVVMGMIIAFVVMSVMLPMFDLATVAQKGG